MIEISREAAVLPRGSSRTTTSGWLALGAVAGPSIFTVAWLVLGFVSQGYTAWGTYVPYSPVHQTVSGLGLGATAPYMNAAFIANGVLSFIGIAAVFAGIPGMRRWTRWGCIALLSLPAVGSAVDGVFTLESFLPHMAGFALALTTIVSLPVVGFVLRGVPGWKTVAMWLIAAGPTTLVLTGLFFATFTPTLAGTQTGIAGLTERLLILEIQACFVALGWLAFQRRLSR